MRGTAPQSCPAFNPEHVQFYNIEVSFGLLMA